MRTRPKRVESEVYFRVVHLAGDRRHSAPVSAFREQTVEIILGPKGAAGACIPAAVVTSILAGRA